MSYTSTATATRPDGVLWFNQYDSVKSLSEINWVKAQPGFVSFTITTPEVNSLVSVLVFEDQTSFDTMAALRVNRADWIARQEYCLANGITKTVVRENT
jgi:hypothetical protein